MIFRANRPGTHICTIAPLVPPGPFPPSPFESCLLVCNDTRSLRSPSRELSYAHTHARTHPHTLNHSLSHTHTHTPQEYKRPGDEGGPRFVNQLDQIPDGPVGKLVVHKSGRVRLLMGDIAFEVSSDVFPHFPSLTSACFPAHIFTRSCSRRVFWCNALARGRCCMLPRG